MKILFFRIGAIGDVLLTTAAVKKARELFPGAVIHYLAGRQAAQVLYNNPDIDKIFELPAENSMLPKLFRPLAMKNFFSRSFKNIEYDYFIDFESSYYSVYFSFMIKTKNKVGHRITRKRRGWYNKFYNIRVDYEDGDWYVIKRHLALIKPLKEFEHKGRDIVYRPSDKEKRTALEFLNESGINKGTKTVMLSISSKWETKTWPASHWIKLAELIQKEFITIITVILPAPEDPKELTKKLASINNTVVKPPGSLRDLAAVLLYADVLVSNDGAVRHIANALKIKAIGLFSQANEKGWAYEDENNIILTPDVDCRPCGKLTCEKGGCMHLITPETVIENLKKLL